MSTTQTRLQRGRRRGTQVAQRALSELRVARRTVGVSQRSLAAQLGVTQAVVWRLEREGASDVSVVRLSEMASLLGLEVAVTLHPIGDPIRDRGQQALIGRFRALLSSGWQVTAEAPFPALGDARAWDLLVRLPTQRVGVEAETRIRDVQALVRRLRGRESHGGADHVLLVLSDSAVNRRLVGELREALGKEYAATPRVLLGALRRGEPLAGSGVLLR
jgi:transcriptional regulator with XRE-family HTH domain